MKPQRTLLVLAWLVVAVAGSAQTTEDPLAAWRGKVKISVVSPQDGRHTIHSYFNTSPESPDGRLVVTDTIMTGFGGASNEWGVVLADVQGTGQIVIHKFDNSHGAESWRRSHPHPVFSADGKRIYFNVSSGPWTQLYVAERP